MSDPYILQIASQNAEWLTQRQSLVAGNVANANTPGYRAKDLPAFSTLLDSAAISLVSTQPGHLSAETATASRAREIEPGSWEETISGNSVNLEQQMINLGDINRSYTMNLNIQRALHQMFISALK